MEIINISHNYFKIAKKLLIILNFCYILHVNLFINLLLIIYKIIYKKKLDINY